MAWTFLNFLTRCGLIGENRPRVSGMRQEDVFIKQPVELHANLCLNFFNLKLVDMLG